jgi:hypothetical protein
MMIEDAEARLLCELLEIAFNPAASNTSIACDSMLCWIRGDFATSGLIIQEHLEKIKVISTASRTSGTRLSGICAATAEYRKFTSIYP